MSPTEALQALVRTLARTSEAVYDGEWGSPDGIRVGGYSLTLEVTGGTEPRRDYMLYKLPDPGSPLDPPPSPKLMRHGPLEEVFPFMVQLIAQNLITDQIAISRR